MVKHNFWSVKGYFKKQFVKKKGNKKKYAKKSMQKKKKKICTKILPNVLKNRIFGKQQKQLIRQNKPLIGCKTLPL